MRICERCNKNCFAVRKEWVKVANNECNEVKQVTSTPIRQTYYIVDMQESQFIIEMQVNLFHPDCKTTFSQIFTFPYAIF